MGTTGFRGMWRVNHVANLDRAGRLRLNLHNSLTHFRTVPTANLPDATLQRVARESRANRAVVRCRVRNFSCQILGIEHAVRVFDGGQKRPHGDVETDVTPFGPHAGIRCACVLLSFLKVASPAVRHRVGDRRPFDLRQDARLLHCVRCQPMSVGSSARAK